MPCDSITTVSLELKQANKEWLKSAIVSLGYRIEETKDFLRFTKSSYDKGTYEFSSGKLNITALYNNAAAEIGAKIKQAYSKELVMKTATKFGWQNVTGQKTEVRQW